MTGGSRIVDFRRNAAESELEEAGAEPAAVAQQYWQAEEDEAPPTAARERVIGGLIALLAIGWIGFAGWASWTSLAGRTPAAADVIGFVGLLSAPLALLGVIYLLLMRSSAREARRFARTAAAIRAETSLMEAVLQNATARLDENRAALAEQTGSFMGLGEDATARLKVVTEAMQGEVDTLGRQAHALKAAAAAAQGDLSVLLADLPKAQTLAERMSGDLREAGLTAHERAAELELKLGQLGSQGREADEIAGGAAARLAAHLTRMESTSEVAGARLEEAAGQMTEAVDAALTRAADAVDEARKGMEAQAAAMLAMVEQSRAALDQTGQEAGLTLAARVDEINTRISTLGTALAAHAEASGAMTDSLKAALGEIDGQLAALDQTGAERTSRLAEAIDGLSAHADRMSGALQAGSGVADTLIQKSEALFTGLDANARELDEALPAAFDRLDAKAAASKALLATLGPETEKLEMTAVSAYNRLTEADAVFARHRESIEALVGDLDGRIAESRATVEQLAAAIGLARDEAQSFADMAAPQLVESLVRVRETAQHAAERARETLASIVPASAAALAEASDRALSETITARVEAQMADMAAAAERAIATSHEASDRLMRQMLTIADTAAAVEERISEARDEAERVNNDGFARRCSLLIESLNSTAIDVTKILSNDVTDSAWAAYLKGDRGVFTRRAVRLLDAGEVREIAHHYDTEPEFREQVNRYIHDFEAMLRNILATRDGSPLGVTLLSSDMGKLYVALAQAIERLRT